MKIKTYNPLTENLELSYLSNSYSVGVTSIEVRNSNRFTAADYILIGEQGFEHSEVVTVSNVNANGTTLTVAATKFPHSTDDPVYDLKYNQIRYYRSTTGVNGTYSLVATVNVDVDNSDRMTVYDDTTGLSAYYYKTSYYNSTTDTESTLSDPIAGSGYARTQAGSIVNDALDEVGDTDQNYMTVTQALNILDECNDDLSTQSGKPYRTLKKSALLTITASTDRLSIPSDVLAIDRIKYEYVSGTEDRTDNIRLIDIEEMEYAKYDGTMLASDELNFIAIDDTTNELVFYPTPQTTQTLKLRMYYWQKFPDFTGMSTTINLPTPRVYKLFLIARFYRMRALHDASFLPLSDRYSADYATEVVKLQRINRLDRGSSRGYRPDTGNARQLRKY